MVSADRIERLSRIRCWVSTTHGEATITSTSDLAVLCPCFLYFRGRLLLACVIVIMKHYKKASNVQLHKNERNCPIITRSKGISRPCLRNRFERQVYGRNRTYDLGCGATLYQLSYVLNLKYLTVWSVDWVYVKVMTCLNPLELSLSRSDKCTVARWTQSYTTSTINSEVQNNLWLLFSVS